MMKLILMQTKETKNYVCYESGNFEFAFRMGEFAAKLWVPKSEFRIAEEKEGMPFPIDGHINNIFLDTKKVTTYPPEIEIGVLDDSDTKPAPLATSAASGLGGPTLADIIAQAKAGK